MLKEPTAPGIKSTQMIVPMLYKLSDMLWLGRLGSDEVAAASGLLNSKLSEKSSEALDKTSHV
jgi:hypothetical protein